MFLIMDQRRTAKNETQSMFGIARAQAAGGIGCVMGSFRNEQSGRAGFVWQDIPLGCVLRKAGNP